MDDTVTAIVDGSYLPLSIIIIGVGAADFSPMEELDADGTLLVSSNGKQAMRDCVQFVPMRNFEGANSGAALAKETLRELPEQVTSFFAARGIVPNEPLAANSSFYNRTHRSNAEAPTASSSHDKPSVELRATTVSIDSTLEPKYF